MSKDIYGDLNVHGIINVGVRDTTGGYSLPYNIGNNTTILGVSGSTVKFLDTINDLGLATQAFATVTLSGAGPVLVTKNSNNNFVISITGDIGTGGSGNTAILQGAVNCDIYNSTYTITHPVVDTNYTFPIISLTVPSSSSSLYVQGILNRTSYSFDVALSNVPESTGYKINWSMPISGSMVSNVVTFSSSANLYDYTTLSVTRMLTGNLETKISLASANSYRQLYNLIVATSGSGSSSLTSAASANAYIQAVNTINSTPVGVLLQGNVQCNTTTNVYPVAHSYVNINSVYPLLSLSIPDSGSVLYINGISNRTSTGFNIVLSDIPSVSGYSVNWTMPTSGINILSLQERYNDFINVKDFGAVGDGVTDDTNAIQAAITSISSLISGGTVVFPNGVYNCSDIYIFKPNISLQGKGVLKNTTIHIGNDVQQNLYTDINGIRIHHDGITTNKHAISIKNTKYFNIHECEIYNADCGIYFEPIDSTQHSARGSIHNNRIWNCNYDLYCDKPTSGANVFVVGDLHFNNNIINANKSHLYLKGIDGIDCKGNTMFFIGYPAGDTIKEHNIYIDYCNWAIIEGNNLFEAGVESILISHFQNANIHGNNIAWCGQKQPASAILCISGDNASQEYCISTIASNNIMFPTGNGIDIRNNCGHIAVTSNQMIGVGNNTYYYGSVPLSGISHFAIVAGASTQYINVFGNLAAQNELSINGTNSNFIGNLTSSKERATKEYFISVVDTSTSVTLDGANIINLAQPSPTTITTISTPYNESREISLYAFNGNTTIQNSAGILLKGGIDAVLPQWGSLTLFYNAGQWIEKCRNF
jgi:hypothetical protein